MKFIIISLAKGSADAPVFWRPNAAGYTSFPWAAGIYSEDEIKNNPDYFNNGYTTIAVPFNQEGMESIGLKCTYDKSLLKELHKSLQQKLTSDQGYQNFYHSEPANNLPRFQNPPPPPPPKPNSEVTY